MKVNLPETLKICQFQNLALKSRYYSLRFLSILSSLNSFQQRKFGEFFITLTEELIRFLAIL